MKGIIFTELVEMVEATFSPELMDELMEEAELPSKGIYTSVGTYDHSEILTLVTLLSEKVDMPVVDLVKAFGQHLAGRFVIQYPMFFEKVDGLFGFLETVDNHVHVEVKKLYPDAELPNFATERVMPDTLKMTYRSSRPFNDVAEGLIKGCSEHFGETIDMSRKDAIVDDLFISEFLIKRVA